MILKRSFISELTNSAGGAFTVMFTIVLAVGMVQVLNLAAGGRIGSATVLEMIVYQVLGNLAPLISLTGFVAVLMTMMRWWQDNEMVVWYSSGGRSLLSWIDPTLRFIIPIAVLVGALSLVVTPWAKAQSELIRAEFKQRDEVNALAPGKFIESMGGRRVFFIESLGDRENEVGRVFLAEQNGDKEVVVNAAGGSIEVNREGDRYVVLHDGRRYETNRQTAETRVVEFNNYGMRLDIKVDTQLRASRLVSQPLPLLLADPTAEHQGELAWRLSWPLVTLNLALLALPLSCTAPRAGRSLNLIIAALSFILYLNGISIMQTWIEQERVGLWKAFIGIHSAVFILAVILFIRRVYMQRWLPAPAAQAVNRLRLRFHRRREGGR